MGGGQWLLEGPTDRLAQASLQLVTSLVFSGAGGGDPSPYPCCNMELFPGKGMETRAAVPLRKDELGHGLGTAEIELSACFPGALFSGRGHEGVLRSN